MSRQTHKRALINTFFLVEVCIFKESNIRSVRMSLRMSWINRPSLMGQKSMQKSKQILKLNCLQKSFKYK